jgi:hypothetical protein
MAMDGSSSSDGSRRNGKRAAGQSFLDRLREPKRGVGIAKLEKMRVEEEMRKEKYLHDPFNRPRISGPGLGIQGMVSSTPFFFLFAKFVNALVYDPFCVIPACFLICVLYHHFMDYLFA